MDAGVEALGEGCELGLDGLEREPVDVVAHVLPSVLVRYQRHIVIVTVRLVCWVACANFVQETEVEVDDGRDSDTRSTRSMDMDKFEGNRDSILMENRPFIPKAEIKYMVWLTRNGAKKTTTSMIIEFSRPEDANKIISEGLV